MEIWLDTADLDLILEVEQMGILHGVTTNPTIVSKSKLQLEDLLEKILALQKGAVTAQVTAEDAPKMIAQGVALYEFSPRIMVKIPLTTEGLKAIRALSDKNIPTMATAIFDPSQVLLAARAGATYIAPYFSTICDSDICGADQFKSMLRMVERYKFPSKILAASIKTTEQACECLELGAQAMTLNPIVFRSFTETHAETAQRIRQFNKDWQNAQSRRSLPL